LLISTTEQFGFSKHRAGTTVPKSPAREFYAHHMLRFARDHVIGEEETRKLIHDHGLNLG